MSSPTATRDAHAAQSLTGPDAGEGTRDVNTVLREALEKLKGAAQKRHKELRDECCVELERLEHEPDGPTKGAAHNADDFFKALKLACEATGSPKVVAIALDFIQKLMEYGFLTGKSVDQFKESTDGGPRLLVDSIVECICSCAEQADDTVQYNIIRTLVTAVTSNTCEVHGNSLMLAVKSCFKIHRDSKSSVNQRTAQASLTQILNTVTQRMELSSADMSRRSVAIEEGAGDASRKAAKMVSSDLALLPPRRLLHDWTSSYLTRLVDQVVMEKSAKGGGDAEVCGGAEAGSAPPGKFGWCVECRGSAEHYCVDTKDPVCGHRCKYRNLERLNLVEAHYGARAGEDDEAAAATAALSAGSGPGALMDGAETESTAATDVEQSSVSVISETGLRAEAAMSAMQQPLPLGEDVLAEHSDKALNPYHRDALLVFEYLCALSMKDLPAGQQDTRLVRSKRMALELVHNMLRNCGPVFRSSEPFIDVLRKLLCKSLIRNSVSSNQQNFKHSLLIFVMLITNFKEHLKNEIGVFIEQIFLKILESGNSSYTHKSRVLNVFYDLCTDASTAIELFLNFDCDVEEKNIFERMIDCLSKIAQGKYTAVEHANLIRPDQEQELKLLALKALVTLMGSIVDWARNLTEGLRLKHLEDAPLGDAAAESDGEEHDVRSEAPVPLAATVGQSSIQEQKQRKLELQIGVNKFNMKPKRGIEYLKQNGFVTDDPQAVADLFRNKEIGLDKTAIGDYLGEDKPFNKAVLYALVDGEDFQNQELDSALRTFLSVFRLPGEAQKIDRMMEKFAEKYCGDNPGMFLNNDCAFILSFSLIMLQTDLHNPGIKNKMTKEEFVRNNRGINDNQDLPKEYLEKLYEGVSTNPISLQEDQDAKQRIDSQAAQGASQKHELFQRETESIMKKSEEMMKQKGSMKKTSTYVAAQSTEHVRPLFEVACWPYLATLAVLLEMSDLGSSVELCIEGFKHCIRIAARFDMDTERDAFVSSLAKFTYLTTVKEMKQKNIECIKALLAIGLSEGNNLGPSWQYVLYCISQLERLQLIGNRSRQDFQFFQGEDEFATQSSTKSSSSVSTSGNQVLKRRAHGLGVSALVSLGSDDRQVELVNSESVVSQIDGTQIDLLFNRSTKLGSNAIVHFVRQLARVSKDELALPDQPRIFSLQKLVEVADYNMNRMRVVWKKIWNVVSAHFVEVACHANIRVCMYAIDALKQLAWKFLEKDELSNYNFQADFLKPFEDVMVSTPGVSREIKELIVNIIRNMVQGRNKNIKSGWKTVFHILHAAAQEQQNEAMTQMSFNIMEQVMEKNYSLFIENFVDGVRTLLAFGQRKANLNISLQAISYLCQAAEYLAKKSGGAKLSEASAPAAGAAGGVTPGTAPSVDSSAASTGAEIQTPVASASEALSPPTSSAAASHPAAHWFQILRGLSTLVSDPRRDVRAAALNGVFDCLRDHGSAVFDEDTWRMVFNGVIKPLFDDIHHQLQHADQRSDGARLPGSTEVQGTAASWAASMGPPTCLAALTALVRLFEAHLDSLSFLLPEVLRLIESCIQHDTEAVARIGVEGFKQLLLHTGKSLSQESWQKVTESILKLFNDSMPTKLLCVKVSEKDAQLPFRTDDVVIQCVVQLLLIDVLQDTVREHYEHIPPAGIMTLLDALQRSFEFAQDFNQQIELRQTLKKLGFMRDMKQLPALLKQEREALSCSLNVLFQVQGDERMLQSSEISSQAVERLMKLCYNVLRNYVRKEQLLQQHQEDPENAPGGPQDRDAVLVEIDREVQGLVKIISEVVMRGLKDLQPEQFAKHAQELFPLLCECSTVNSREVRLVVRDVLMQQIAPLVSAATRQPHEETS